MRYKTPPKQPLVNHIAFVIDASSSMTSHKRALVAVADNQVAYLARRSQEMGQETRISVFSFADEVECLVWDTDVLRLPSIKDLYEPYGWTALIDGAATTIDHLTEIPQRHGDHSFLLYVLTDGQENRSHRFTQTDLVRKIGWTEQQQNWTLAVFVPDQICKREAIAFGFPKDNVAIWDATAQDGSAEVGRVMTDATESYMTSRAAGVRGTRSVFATSNATPAAVAQADLDVLPAASYVLIPVTPTPKEMLVNGEDPNRPDIRSFVNRSGLGFTVGSAYYQHSKMETVQGHKALALVEKSTGKVFIGQQVRDLLGLDGDTKRVKPDHNPAYDLFVQSTSNNRKLVLGTRLLVLR